MLGKPVPLNKYRSLERNEKGEELHWGRVDLDGAPLAGDIPRSGLPEREIGRLTYPCLDVKAELFDLSDPEQRERYREVLDRIANGWYRLIVRHFAYDEETKCWRVWMEWGERYVRLRRPLSL